MGGHVAHSSCSASFIYIAFRSKVRGCVLGATRIYVCVVRVMVQYALVCGRVARRETK